MKKLMRRRAVPISAVLTLLTACGSQTPPESADFLASHRERLKAVTRACRDHPLETNASICAAAAEAERRRFMGNGTPYTPQSVQVAPATRAKE